MFSVFILKEEINFKNNKYINQYNCKRKAIAARSKIFLYIRSESI